MNIDKKQLKIANNYAKALFKIGKEQNSVDKFYEQLKDIVGIIKNSNDLKTFFENLLVSANDKKEVIYKIFGKDFDLQIINLLNLLADNKRMELVDTVYYCFEKLYERICNIKRITVASAIELNSASKKRLEKIIEIKTGSSIIPSYKIKKDIIGGLIIKIGDKIIDLSLASKINDMEKQLI